MGSAALVSAFTAVAVGIVGRPLLRGSTKEGSKPRRGAGGAHPSSRQARVSAVTPGPHDTIHCLQAHSRQQAQIPGIGPGWRSLLKVPACPGLGGSGGRGGGGLGVLHHLSRLGAVPWAVLGKLDAGNVCLQDGAVAASLGRGATAGPLVSAGGSQEQPLELGQAGAAAAVTVHLPRTGAAGFGAEEHQRAVIVLFRGAVGAVCGAAALFQGGQGNLGQENGERRKKVNFPQIASTARTSPFTWTLGTQLFCPTQYTHEPFG